METLNTARARSFHEPGTESTLLRAWPMSARVRVPRAQLQEAAYSGPNSKVPPAGSVEYHINLCFAVGLMVPACHYASVLCRNPYAYAGQADN